jgi:hypothetical protein
LVVGVTSPVSGKKSFETGDVFLPPVIVEASGILEKLLPGKGNFPWK